MNEKCTSVPPSEIENPNTYPTWDEWANVNRKYERARAQVNVLRSEVEGLEQQIADVEAELLVSTEKVKNQKDRVEVFRDKLDEARKETKVVEETTKALRLRVGNLERENGMLEAQVARAQGRCVVIAGSAQAEMLAQALVQVRDICAHATAARSDIGAVAYEVEGGPKLRQLHSIARRALEESGAAERSAQDIEKLRKQLAGS
jgi:chromosome segregation ATPase